MMRESTIVILVLASIVGVLEAINLLIIGHNGTVLTAIVASFSAMAGAYLSYRKFSKGNK